MSRFLTFAGQFYYPSGGWNDFQGSFESLDDAKGHMNRLDTMDWLQIVDQDLNEVHQRLHTHQLDSWTLKV